MTDKKTMSPSEAAKRESEASRIAREREADKRQAALRRMEDAGHINPPRRFG